MDDTLEQKPPRTRAGSRAKSPRAADAAAAEVKVAKPRTASSSKSKPQEAKPARKAPARRKPRADAEPAIREAKPKAKPAKATKPKQARKSPLKAPAELPPTPAFPVHGNAPEPQQPPAVSAELPPSMPHDGGTAGDVTIHPVAPHVPNPHPHDDGLEFGLSPVDLAPDASVREEAGFGWFVRILALSSLLLVLFNSFAIDKWAREQPVTRFNSQILVAAHQLHNGMKSVHLDAPLESMRSLWHGIRDTQWPGSASGRKQPEQDRGVAR